MNLQVLLMCVFFALTACSNNPQAPLHNEHSSSIENDRTDDTSKRSFIQKVIGDTTNYTTIQWIDSSYQELGNVKEGEVAEISWRFKNTGNKPLIIVNTNAACGCTVAEKPEQPIPPGEEGVIKAIFNSKGQFGMYRRGVDVLANTKKGNLHALSFGVRVEKQPS